MSATDVDAGRRSERHLTPHYLEVHPMRTLRAMATGLALVTLLPATGAAQDGRFFRDSWFWGVKTGVMTFSTPTVSHQPAPMIGLEWLITRTRGGLYLSVDNSFFDKTSAVQDFPDPTTARPVRIKNMYRISAAALAFPGSFRVMHPYAGLGFAINVIRDASPTGTFASQDAADTTNARASEAASQAAPLLMGGVQTQYRRVSVFVQASVQPTGDRFLLHGDPAAFIEGGVRYNFGRAFERQ